MAAPAPTPAGPRNLARSLADWLRQQGFTVTEREQPPVVAVEAHWVGSQGERFQLNYTWVGGAFPEAQCQLGVLYVGKRVPETLFTAQHVRRIKDARLLVGNCVRYHNARLLAKMPHSAL